MSAKKQREEIYLLSLDTFMILAISGICIGIIFIVFNSQVGRVKPPPPPPKTLECSEFIFQDFVVQLQERFEDRSGYSFFDGDFEKFAEVTRNDITVLFYYIPEEYGFSLSYTSSTERDDCEYPVDGKSCLNKIEDFIIKVPYASFRSIYNNTLKDNCIPKL